MIIEVLRLRPGLLYLTGAKSRSTLLPVTGSPTKGQEGGRVGRRAYVAKLVFARSLVPVRDKTVNDPLLGSRRRPMSRHPSHSPIHGSP